jgi:16S rRNA (cytosine1402-N4)-methyltransferase
MPKQKDQVHPPNFSEEKFNRVHTPVLLNEVLDYLKPQVGQSYLDVTAGFGGHAQAVLKLTSGAERSVLADRDEQAIKALHGLFGKSGIEIIHQDFLSASKELARQGRKFDMILADLGVSSQHLTEASRGFAIKLSGPLDMRMDKRQTLTADLIVNEYSELELSKILSEYGEEPKARLVARLIIAARPIHTTEQLAHIVAKAWPGHSRVHPATRTFQALRIAVNSELEQLRQSLPFWVDMLKPEGRLAVISFHSLEDRIVKDFFKEHSENPYDADLTLLTKKPVMATNNELVSNPRARSAKLRVSSKNKNK